MNDKFSVTPDHACGMIRIAMTGLFTPGDARDIRERCREAIDALGLPLNAHLTFTDVRTLKILPQETLTAFCEMLADPDFHSRRLAFVVAPTLVRAQVVRALGGRDNARCFDDPATAEAWLLAEDEQAPAVRKAGRG